MASNEPFYELKATLRYIKQTGHTNQNDLSSRGGLSDEMYDEIEEYKRRENDSNHDNEKVNMPHGDAARLKKYVEELIAVRNEDMSKSFKYCKAHMGTTCSSHSYSNYSQLMQKVTGMSNPISSGDIYNAISSLTYCTCNVRHTSECVCLSHKLMDHCQCNTRTSPPLDAYTSCDCRDRSRGKYDEWRAGCQCLSRTVEQCGCLNRIATIDCTCKTRCSCDGVKEFSYVKPDTSCVCNTKYLPGCECNTLRTQECAQHYCDCFCRSATNKCEKVYNYYNNSGPWYNYKDHSNNYYVESYCNINTNEHHQYSYDQVDAYGICNCQGRYYQCTCVERCACNTLRIEQGQTTHSYSYQKTECSCVSRGGEHKMDSAGDHCYCRARTSEDTCSGHAQVEYDDGDGGTSWAWNCSCVSRTAQPVCICVYRTACIDVYRTVNKTGIVNISDFVNPNDSKLP